VPLIPPKAEDMVRILVKGNEAVAATARELLPLTEKAGDQPTTDLLSARMDIHEKSAWMLRSMLGE
jgi:starvation-inducible DNA-binding protein